MAASSLFDSQAGEDPFGSDATKLLPPAKAKGSPTNYRKDGRTVENDAYDLAGGVSIDGCDKKRPKQNRFDSRTKQLLESQGYYVEKTEWQVTSGYGAYKFQARKDLLGFGDLIALKEGLPALIVQVTSRESMGQRIRKMRDLPASRMWLKTGNSIVVIGWHKPANRWESCWTTVTLELLDKFEARKRK